MAMSMMFGRMPQQDLHRAGHDPGDERLDREAAAERERGDQDEQHRDQRVAAQGDGLAHPEEGEHDRWDTVHHPGMAAQPGIKRAHTPSVRALPCPGRHPAGLTDVILRAEPRQRGRAAPRRRGRAADWTAAPKGRAADWTAAPKGAPPTGLPRQRGRAADWTEERGSEERATERRGKAAGIAPPAGARAERKQGARELHPGTGTAGGLAGSPREPGGRPRANPLAPLPVPPRGTGPPAGLTAGSLRARTVLVPGWPQLTASGPLPVSPDSGIRPAAQAAPRMPAT